jgi:hypothetical protein
MRFRHEGDSPVSVPVKAWAFPGTTDFIQVSETYDPGDVTADFPPGHFMLDVLKQHPEFKPFLIPTLWERLLIDP